MSTSGRAYLESAATSVLIVFLLFLASLAVGSAVFFHIQRAAPVARVALAVVTATGAFVGASIVAALANFYVAL